MRAVVVREAGGPEALELVEVPVPTAGVGQVRIRVEAAAVNPVDALTRSGALGAAGLLPPRDVVGIGWDVAGSIDEVGPGVRGFAPGERVIGVRDRLDVTLGTYADFVVLDAAAVAAAPARLSAAEAATLPLNGLTALQALDRLVLAPGATLLVTGAAGAVGGYAVQLAALRGLRVVAYAGAADEEFARAVGAQWFVPRSGDLAEDVRALVPGGVDAALDTAVLGVAALGAVRNHGSFVSVVGGAAPVPLRGITVTEQWVAADDAALARLSALAEDGRLTARVADTMPLAEAVRAHRRLDDREVLRGRLVLVP
ncbi:NADP-dependent oxidoreductase [Streptomyces flavofungini]|uniref:NADP-dependent oxidoreductase n=1 Tax=Streptomyces flavofungini TaxID=68200 RepID=A0ABS0X7V7_9ACTN|nr:NADP-dependent oxidoreductase [Streptomyces flavofungini]MBJ3809292.1 NADP-dependent oxidoreductase [Streptomyces flavofungini]GHC77407.1 NADPH:quinone reductase [Streptomyces flavofungini]